MKDRGGVVAYIRIALEKGFSDTYGSWGGRRPPRGATEARTKGVPQDFGQFWPILTEFEPFSVIFAAIFSSFQPRTPLKGRNWGKPRPEMDSAPSK